MPPALLLWLPVAVPLLAAVLLAMVPRPRRAALGGVVAAAAGLLSVLALCLMPRGPTDVLAGGLLRGDALSLWMLILSTSVGFATALHTLATLHADLPGRVEGRLRHVSLQLTLAAAHLALLADAVVLTWAALLCGVLASLPTLTLRRTPAAMDAAWRMLLSCGAGLALALFGTVLLALATGSAPGAAGTGWAEMAILAPAAAPGPLGLGFVFLLMGYGALAGLVPAHGWLAAAQLEGTAAGAATSGLLAVAAVHAVLRARLVLLGAPDVLLSPDDLLLALGLLSLTVAALASLRRGDLGRLLARTGTGHTGLVLLCFGVGAPLAGILHLSAQLLLRVAALFALDRALGPAAGREATGPSGLVASRPGLGWGLLLALAGLAGLPPAGLFASELGLSFAAAREAPWLLLPLCLGLAVLAAALLGALRWTCLGPPALDRPTGGVPVARSWAGALPVWGCVVVALLLGIITPSLLLQAAAVAGR